MSAESLGETRAGLRPIDRQLLGLSPDPSDPDVLWFDLVPHLCRTDGRFYGGGPGRRAGGRRGRHGPGGAVVVDPAGGHRRAG
jgi:hypothetical protein